MSARDARAVLAHLCAGIVDDLSVYDDLDALTVVEAAERHRVHALLVHEWASADDVPPWLVEVIEALRAGVQRAAVVDALSTIELRRVLDALRAADVSALVFKGSALGHQVYEVSHLRPRQDTDLLVDEDDFERARETLEELGYEAPNQIPGDLANNAWAFLRQDETSGAHVIDLHWRFNNGPSIAPGFSPSALLGRSVEVEALGGARAPRLVDALLLAAVHAYTHHAGQAHPLIWLVDMDRIARRLDDAAWDDVVDRARANEVWSVTAQALADTRDALGTPLPPRVEELLAQPAPDDAARVYLDPQRGRVMLKELAGLPSWSDRARMLQQLAFPPADYMLSEYGVADEKRLPLLYAHRLARAAWRYTRPRRRRDDG
jgi:hypothetical protein